MNIGPIIILFLVYSEVPLELMTKMFRYLLSEFGRLLWTSDGSVSRVSYRTTHNNEDLTSCELDSTSKSPLQSGTLCFGLT